MMKRTIFFIAVVLFMQKASAQITEDSISLIIKSRHDTIAKLSDSKFIFTITNSSKYPIILPHKRE
mgnify:CR=1 FL=1